MTGPHRVSTGSRSWIVFGMIVMLLQPYRRPEFLVFDSASLAMGRIFVLDMFMVDDRARKGSEKPGPRRK